MILKNLKVLHIMNKATTGGIPQVVINICQQEISKSIKFDCTVFDDNFGISGKILKQLGCHFYLLPKQSKNPIGFIIKLIYILKTGKYDIIHVHTNHSSWLPIMVAWFCGIKNRIAHSHTSKKAGIIRQFLSTKITPLFATNLIGCTILAGQTVFGRNVVDNSKFKLFYNTIDVKNFAFKLSSRINMRHQMKLKGKFVFGCVGRLDTNKNFIFALDVFHIIQKKLNESKLLIIGEGTLRKDLEEKVNKLRLNKEVIFVGNKKNINDYYQVMDCFLFPSLHEGFGIAAIEAQCSGLPCFISDGVPDAAMICNTTKIPLSKSAKQWADIILEKINKFERKDCSDIIKKAGLDITNTSNKIEQIYLQK